LPNDQPRVEKLFFDSTNDATAKALLKRIDELQYELDKQKKITQKWKNKFVKLRISYDKLTKGLHKWFSKDQISIIEGKKFTKWSVQSIRKGLLAMHKCGTKFYKILRKKFVPLPSYDTCNRKIANFKIQTGIIDFNCVMLNKKYEKISNAKRRIGLVFDEKAIVPGIQWDASNKKNIGKVTLKPSSNLMKKDPECEKLAKNMLVVMAAGFDTRIKLPIGVHLTAGCTDGNAMKQFILECIVAVETIGKVKVDYLCMDLGPSNCSFLKSLDISVSLSGEKYSFQHPLDEKRSVFIIPDIIHVFKNITSALRKRDILISDSLVTQFHLSSNIATFKNILQVYNKQQKYEFKLARDLKFETVRPNHFEVMKEKNSFNLLSQSVSTSIQLLDYNSQNCGKNNATSWLLNVLNILHEVILDKTGWSADEKEKMDTHTELFNWILDSFIPGIKFIGFRLPSIAGLSMALKSILKLNESYLNLEIYPMIMSRYLSNCVENLFSAVTQISSKPSALHMLYALRQISIEKFEIDSTTGNYSIDEIDKVEVNFIDILQQFNGKEDDNSDNELTFIPLIQITDEVKWETLFTDIGDFNAFYCFVNESFHRSQIATKCAKCLSSLKNHEPYSGVARELSSLRAKMKGLPEILIANVAVDYYLKLEFVFQKLRNFHDINHIQFAEFFLESASLIIFPEAHCKSLALTLSSSYVKDRVQSIVCRLPHQSNKHASKSLV
jgi:hypothetical protein